MLSIPDRQFNFQQNFAGFSEPGKSSGDSAGGNVDNIEKVLSAFQTRAKTEQKRFEKATDSEYWVCVCFQTRDEKESFLKNAGLLECGDKYLDGWDVAEKLGVKFEREVEGFGKLKVDRKYKGLT